MKTNEAIDGFQFYFVSFRKEGSALMTARIRARSEAEAIGVLRRHFGRTELVLPIEHEGDDLGQFDPEDYYAAR